MHINAHKCPHLWVLLHLVVIHSPCYRKGTISMNLQTLLCYIGAILLQLSSIFIFLYVLFPLCCSCTYFLPCRSKQCYLIVVIFGQA